MDKPGRDRTLDPCLLPWRRSSLLRGLSARTPRWSDGQSAAPFWRRPRCLNARRLERTTRHTRNRRPFDFESRFGMAQQPTIEQNDHKELQ